MDFSRLEEEEVKAFILLNQENLEEDIYLQAKDIFSFPSPQYTYPVLDLYIATQLESQGVSQTYTLDQIQNLSQSNREAFSQTLSLPLDDQFTERVVRILQLMGSLDLLEPSEDESNKEDDELIQTLSKELSEESSEEYPDSFELYQPISIPQPLLEEINLYREIDPQITLQEIPILESFELILELSPLEVLPELTLRSWRTNPEIPIYLSLTYSDFPNLPNFSIYQVQGESFGLEFQLRNILQTYLASHPFEPGFLYTLKFYLMDRLTNLQQHCIICDELHILSERHMVRRTICQNPLCWFSYQYMGVAKDEFEYLESSIEVINLIFQMTRIASKSRKREDILNPFPLIINPSNSNDLILDPEKPNYRTLESILKPLPETLDFEYEELKPILLSLHEYSFPLLQWIISSNRAHLLKLEDSEQLTLAQTPNQFLMLTQPPEKEAKFRELKVQHNSTFAFHGSPFENWHAIIRGGLRNASGTRLQRHGAAYGKGIYLSPSLNMSFQYSSMGSGLKCVAICEVINTQIKRNGDVWVVQNEDLVYTRFLLVYPSGFQLSGPISIDTLLPEIQQTLMNYGM